MNVTNQIYSGRYRRERARGTPKATTRSSLLAQLKKQEEAISEATLSCAKRKTRSIN